ncbi:tetratricopeptide repeat protein [Gorillibacterium massiliense]|uniref:tetratricopeptide repeat protein n=1 Tax=Gorillibacterium massiliense TaxID=1280390 RepID=UPI0004B6DBED|nr:tetratricopeptide repeat protein [Gorillibacterium massiliense]
MSGKVKMFVMMVVMVVAIVAAFMTHWWLGFILLALIVGISLFVNRSVLYIQQGNRAYMAGDIAKSLALMEKAYKINPNRPNHQLNYGYLLLRASKLDQAEQVLEKLLNAQIAPDAKLQARINLASVYWLQNKHTEALSLLEEALKEVKNTLLYGNLGYFKILDGQLDEALALNLEAYEYNDNDLTILDNLAQNYYLLGRLEEAEEIYVKVIAKSPRYAESYYYYALTLQQLGKRDEAREQIAIALEKELPFIPSVKREDIERLAKELGADRDNS